MVLTGISKSPSESTRDLIKPGAAQTDTSLFEQYDAGERVDLLDDYWVFIWIRFCFCSNGIADWSNPHHVIRMTRQIRGVFLPSGTRTAVYAECSC